MCSGSDKNHDIFGIVQMVSNYKMDMKDKEKVIFTVKIIILLPQFLLFNRLHAKNVVISKSRKWDLEIS